MAWSSQRPAQFRSVFQRHCIFLFAFLSLWGKMDCLSLRVKRDARLYHYSRAVLFLSVCRNTVWVYARLHYSSSKSQAFLPQFLLLLSTDHFRRVRRSAPSIMRGWRFRVAEADSVACIYVRKRAAIAEKEKKHYPVNESARGFMDSECRKGEEKKKRRSSLFLAARSRYIQRGLIAAALLLSGLERSKAADRHIQGKLSKLMIAIK